MQLFERTTSAKGFHTVFISQIVLHFFFSGRKLLVSLCELIPKLKSRQVKSSAEGGASGGGGGGKKKRKKR